MKIKEQLVISIMRERIKREILRFEGEFIREDVDKLVDKILEHIAYASERMKK